MPEPVRNNGMTSSAAALRMLEHRQQVLANNLANASTNGFKAQVAFARMIGDAVAATDTTADMTQGSLTDTRNALDLSVEGRGFFVMATPAGERHIRGGSFQLDQDRQLVDLSGNAVLGDQGPIVLPTGDVSISPDGQVRVNAKVVAQLRFESVDAAAIMVHEGGTMFVPDASRKPMPLAERRIHQGSIEGSNVNTMAAMTEMVEVMHRYNAAQKNIATIDSIRGIAVNDLAKPV